MLTYNLLIRVLYELGLTLRKRRGCVVGGEGGVTTDAGGVGMGGGESRRSC